jgi:transglutaminase-like putative cysteine protease
VVLSQQLLHLTPRALPWQRCDQHEITVEPTAGEMTQREDYYGNRTMSLVIAVPHTELVVRAASTVSIEPRTRAALAATKISWEAVRARLGALDHPLAEPAEFLFDSPHVERSQELADYAVKSFTARRAILDAATDLGRRIHRDFKFDRTATSVSTPLKQVLKQKSGVCQDFAHLMIGCLRSRGLAARYVSGYLRAGPINDAASKAARSSVGAGASHAWVAVYTPPFGWLEIDPTNNVWVGTDHVAVAWGRDFGDVSPLHGVILGGASHELKVSVSVEPLTQQ